VKSGKWKVESGKYREEREDSRADSEDLGLQTFGIWAMSYSSLELWLCGVGMKHNLAQRHSNYSPIGAISS
jgi:hypothetical protein